MDTIPLGTLHQPAAIKRSDTQIEVIGLENNRLLADCSLDDVDAWVLQINFCTKSSNVFVSHFYFMPQQND